MNCNQAQPELLDYSKGLLEPHKAEEIKAHLDGCAECRTVLEAEVLLDQQLADAQRPVPDSERVWALIEPRIRQVPHRVNLLNMFRAAVARRLMAAAAAFAVVIVAALVFIPHQPSAPALDVKARTAELVTMMKTQPVDQQIDPVGTTEDMMSILQDELYSPPVKGDRT